MANDQDSKSTAQSSLETRKAVTSALSAAASAGILTTEKTLGDVIKIGQKGSVGTLGHAIAWDRYVLVVA